MASAPTQWVWRASGSLRLRGVACHRCDRCALQGGYLCCVGLPGGSGYMDRVSTYPRYPWCPSPPPPERAVSTTVCTVYSGTVGSCGDDANLCPLCTVASALCQAVPLDTASAALSAHVSAGIPRPSYGPCRVLGATVPRWMRLIVLPFPSRVCDLPLGCQASLTERPRSGVRIRVKACPVRPWCGLSVAQCCGGR